MINSAVKRRSAFARGIPWMILRKIADGRPDGTPERRQSLGFYIAFSLPIIVKIPAQPPDTATDYFPGPGVADGVGFVHAGKPACNVLYMQTRGVKPTYRKPPGKHHATYRRTAVPQLPGSFYVPVYPNTKAP